MKKILSILLTAVFIFSGCMSVEKAAGRQLKFTGYGAGFSARPSDYPVDLYFEGKPAKDFETIGKIAGSIDREKYLEEMLMMRVREAGGDAAINIKTKREKAGGTYFTVEKETIPAGGVKPVTEPYAYERVSVEAEVVRYR
ncbi:MAG: hypothetical protein FJZ09_00425 [Candidatus Omnitrophica bacterium]|nr:hypothetical protein [Candidatus Omnitrophota bacterium]